MRELIRIGNVVYDVSGFNSRAMEMLRRAPEAFPTRRVQPQLVSGTYTKAIREAACRILYFPRWHTEESFLIWAFWKTFQKTLTT